MRVSLFKRLFLVRVQNGVKAVLSKGQTARLADPMPSRDRHKVRSEKRPTQLRYACPHLPQSAQYERDRLTNELAAEGGTYSKKNHSSAPKLTNTLSPSGRRRGTPQPPQGGALRTSTSRGRASPPHGAACRRRPVRAARRRAALARTAAA